MRTRIICVGNDLVRDDGVGIRIGQILTSLPLPETVEVELAPQLGFDLVELLAGVERIVLVDAMCTGRAPGTCVVSDGAAIEQCAGAAGSHTAGIHELVELAHRLAPGKPRPTLTVVGIEGRNFTNFGSELSPEVEAAIPGAVQAVLRLIDADLPHHSRGKNREQ